MRGFHLRLLLILLLYHIVKQPNFLPEIYELMRINVQDSLAAVVRLVGIQFAPDGRLEEFKARKIGLTHFVDEVHEEPVHVPRISLSFFDDELCSQKVALVGQFALQCQEEIEPRVVLRVHLINTDILQMTFVPCAIMQLILLAQLAVKSREGIIQPISIFLLIDIIVKGLPADALHIPHFFLLLFLEYLILNP